MPRYKLWDCTKESTDPDIQMLYSAGFTEEQVIAINKLISKCLNFHDKNIIGTMRETSLRRLED